MITILFGAGASRDFFSPELTTQYLTDSIKCKQNWVEALDKYRDKKDNHVELPSADEVLGIIGIITSTNRNYNFEQIAEVLDKLCSYWFDPLPTNTMLGSLINTFTAIYGTSKFNRYRGWDDVPFLYREILVKSILELQNGHKSSQYQILCTLQQRFVKSICDKDDNVSLVSLNYDECLTDSISGLGFDMCFKSSNSDNQLNELDISKFFNTSNVVYYPHGHVRFRFTDQLNVEYYHDGNIADEERWNGLESALPGCNMPVTQGKFAYNFNSFLTTGQTKDDVLNYLPYAVYYQRLAMDLANSDTIFIIGYSFGDEHINRLLRSYIKRSKTNKVIIVDYYPNDITMTEEHHDSENLILKIHNVFGAEWRVNVNQMGEMTPWNIKDVLELNTNGYGKIFDNVYLYKNGYTQFLVDLKDKKVAL